MIIEVTNELKVTFKNEKELPILEEINFLIIGNFIGAIYNNNIMIRNDALNYFKSIYNNRNKIYEFMQYTIGKFYLILKSNDEIECICSPSSSGLFYINSNEKIIYSDTEVELFDFMDLNDLDEFEVFNFIISHHGLKSPFSSIFNSIRRIIGGQSIRISRSSIKNIELYLLKDLKKFKKTKQRYNYEKFKFYFENTIKLICDYYKDYPIYLFLSGGIDSTVLFICFNKYCENISTLHWANSKAAKNMAQSICDIFKQDLICLEKSNTNLTREYKKIEIENAYKKGLGVNSYWNSAGLRHYEVIDSKSFAIGITGQNMDSLYFIDTFAPGINAFGFYYLKKLVKTIPKRFKYNYINLFFLKLVNKLSSGVKFKKDLKSICYSNLEHSISNKNNSVLKNELSGLDKNYKSFKEKQIINPFFKYLDKDINFHIKFNFSVKTYNYIIRLLKRIRFVQSTSYLYSLYNKNNNYDTLMPITEGPIVQFFNHYILKPKDLFVIKGFLKRYFKENIGKSYDFLRRKVYNVNLLKHSITIVLKKFKIKKIKQAKKDELLISELEDLNAIHTEIISKDVILLKYVKNIIIKNFLNKLILKIKEGKYTKLKKSEIMECEKLVNLEVFLRENVIKN